MSRRTTIEVDDEVLAEVQAVLGTRGLKDSVDEAFARVLRTARQRAFADLIIDGTLIDLDPSLRDEMWR